jgi:hypothetical protein
MRLIRVSEKHPRRILYFGGLSQRSMARLADSENCAAITTLSDFTKERAEDVLGVREKPGIDSFDFNVYHETPDGQSVLEIAFKRSNGEEFDCILIQSDKEMIARNFTKELLAFGGSGTTTDLQSFLNTQKIIDELK